jgi:hypothetical protein
MTKKNLNTVGKLLVQKENLCKEEKNYTDYIF